MKTLFLAIALLFVSASAQAADAGKVYVKLNVHSIAYVSDTSYGTVTGTPAGIAAGFQITDEIGFEVESIQAASSTQSEVFWGTEVKGELSISHTLISGVYTYKISDTFHVLGIAGMNSYTLLQEVTWGGVSVYSESETKTQAYIGAGAGYVVSDMIDVHARYLILASNVTSLSLGATVSF